MKNVYEAAMVLMDVQHLLSNRPGLWWIVIRVDRSEGKDVCSDATNKQNWMLFANSSSDTIQDVLLKIS